MKERRAGFASPEDVLRAEGLPRERKIAILRQWELDERELAVAVEEGMPGPEPELLGRIARALEALDAAPAEGHSTKHGRPPRGG